jgi:hypothetical protein
MHFRLRYFPLALTICLTVACGADNSADDNVGQQQAISKADLRPRIILTTDPELDDLNSLIRFLLYSSDLRIEGLIYASSQFHWKGDGNGTKWFVPGREYTRAGLDICPCESWRWAENERFIHDAVETYEKVYRNLTVHNDKYPTPEELKSRIRFGNVEFDGDISKDTSGSELIKTAILDDETGPLYLAAWGGHSTIARALKSIQEQYEDTPDWGSIREKVASKVILLPSGDQDDTYKNYIKPNWPSIEYRQFSGGPQYGYAAWLNPKPEDSLYLTAGWMKKNVSSRGPMGELYRVWGDGKQMVAGDIYDFFGFSAYSDEELRALGYIVWMPVKEQGSWISEGDTSTFMNLLDNGLRAYEDGSYGGWGGRYEPGVALNVFGLPLSDPTVPDTGQSATAVSINTPPTQGAVASEKPPFPNFFPAAQHDFATRLTWSVSPEFSEANHRPVLAVEGPVNRNAKPGEKIRLTGLVSDPDGDQTSVKWWQFRVGSYPNSVVISEPDSLTTEVFIPDDAEAGQTIHLILEATDQGSPSLSSYKRVIITAATK